MKKKSKKKKKPTPVIVKLPTIPTWMREIADKNFLPYVEVTGYLETRDEDAPPAGTLAFREYHAVKAIQKAILAAKPHGKCRENIKVYQARNARKVRDIGLKCKDLVEVNW